MRRMSDSVFLGKQGNFIVKSDIIISPNSNPVEMKILTRRAFSLPNFAVQLCQLPPLKPPGGKMSP